MGRRELAAEMRSTWMVMREPKNLDGNRRTRRARLAQAIRDARARAVSVRAVEVPAPVGSQEPAESASYSAASTEIA